MVMTALERLEQKIQQSLEMIQALRNENRELKSHSADPGFDSNQKQRIKQRLEEIVKWIDDIEASSSEGHIDE